MLGLLALLLPDRCAVCGAPGVALRRVPRRAHPAEGARLRSVRLPGPGPCGDAPSARDALAFASARSAIVYHARARAFVREWKEHGRRSLAHREAAMLVAEVVPRPDVDLLVHVPGDPERVKRGDVAPRRSRLARRRLRSRRHRSAPTHRGPSSASGASASRSGGGTCAAAWSPMADRSAESASSTTSHVRGDRGMRARGRSAGRQRRRGGGGDSRESRPLD